MSFSLQRYKIFSSNWFVVSFFLRHKKFRSLEENVVLRKPLLKSPRETPPQSPRGGRKKEPLSNPPKRGRKKSVISGFERKWPLMRRK
jgi:hypothetical protein